MRLLNLLNELDNHKKGVYKKIAREQTRKSINRYYDKEFKYTLRELKNVLQEAKNVHVKVEVKLR